MIFSAKHRLGRKVGFRYLRAKKSSSFLSVITGISVGGICVGVLVLVVTLSVMAGFESELKKRLFSAETHVLVENKEQAYFKRDPEMIQRIRQASPLIEQVQPVLKAEAILRSGKRVAGSVVKGVDSEQLEWVKKQVAEWAPQSLVDAAGAPGLLMGAELAYDMAIVPGDLVTVVSPIESEGPFGAVPRVKRFVVQGIYKTGVPEQELHVVFTGVTEVEDFVKEQSILSQIEVRVRNLDDAPKAALAIQTAAGSGFTVRPWQALNAHLFQSLRLERTVMFCILIFIVVVATFNIVSTLTMMVMEKKRSLSILRAMGATPRQISAIFLWESLAIGLVGVLGGLGLGLGVCAFLAKYPIIELPDVFYDRTLPVLVQPAAIAVVAASALVIVLFGAVAPARKASELSPIQGIREG